MTNHRHQNHAKFKSLLARIGKPPICQEYMTDNEVKIAIRNDGAKRFKRKVTGFFGGSPIIKSKKDMAKLLYETGIANSESEGTSLLPQFRGEILYDRGLSAFYNVLKVGIVIKNREEQYMIFAYGIG